MGATLIIPLGPLRNVSELLAWLDEVSSTIDRLPEMPRGVESPIIDKLQRDYRAAISKAPADLEVYNLLTMDRLDGIRRRVDTVPQAMVTAYLGEVAVAIRSAIKGDRSRLLKRLGRIIWVSLLRASDGQVGVDVTYRHLPPELMSLNLEVPGDEEMSELSGALPAVAYTMIADLLKSKDRFSASWRTVHLIDALEFLEHSGAIDQAASKHYDPRMLGKDPVSISMMYHREARQLARSMQIALYLLAFGDELSAGSPYRAKWFGGNLNAQMERVDLAHWLLLALLIVGDGELLRDAAEPLTYKLLSAIQRTLDADPTLFLPLDEYVGETRRGIRSLILSVNPKVRKRLVSEYGGLSDPGHRDVLAATSLDSIRIELADGTFGEADIDTITMVFNEIFDLLGPPPSPSANTSGPPILTPGGAT